MASDPEPQQPDLDGTLKQTEDALAETRDLSIPKEVQQEAKAPKIKGHVLTALIGQGAYAQVWSRLGVAGRVFV